jgi:hypothetical protein
MYYVYVLGISSIIWADTDMSQWSQAFCCYLDMAQSTQDAAAPGTCDTYVRNTCICYSIYCVGISLVDADI